MSVHAADWRRIGAGLAGALGTLVLAAQASAAIFMRYDGHEGESGTDLGQLSGPIGIELHSYPFGVRVADSGNQRLESFGPNLVAGWGVDSGASAFQTCPPT